MGHSFSGVLSGNGQACKLFLLGEVSVGGINWLGVLSSWQVVSVIEPHPFTRSEKGFSQGYLLIHSLPLFLPQIEFFVCFVQRARVLQEKQREEKALFPRGVVAPQIPSPFSPY